MSFKHIITPSDNILDNILKATYVVCALYPFLILISCLLGNPNWMPNGITQPVNIYGKGQAGLFCCIVYAISGIIHAFLMYKIFSESIIKNGLLYKLIGVPINIALLVGFWNSQILLYILFPSLFLTNWFMLCIVLNIICTFTGQETFEIPGVEMVFAPKYEQADFPTYRPDVPDEEDDEDDDYDEDYYSNSNHYSNRVNDMEDRLNKIEEEAERRQKQYERDMWYREKEAEKRRQNEEYEYRKRQEQLEREAYQEKLKREKEEQERLYRTIGNCVQRGTSVHVYNTQGRILTSKSGELVGFTGTTFTVKNGTMCTIYDSYGHVKGSTRV